MKIRLMPFALCLIALQFCAFGAVCAFADSDAPAYGTFERDGCIFSFAFDADSGTLIIHLLSGRGEMPASDW